MFESGRLYLHNDIRDDIQYLLLLLQTKPAIYLSCGTPRADTFYQVRLGDLFVASEVVCKDGWMVGTGKFWLLSYVNSET